MPFLVLMTMNKTLIIVSGVIFLAVAGFFLLRSGQNEPEPEPVTVTQTEKDLPTEVIPEYNESMTDEVNESTEEAKVSDNEKVTYALSEVTEHDNVDDCWLVLNEKVYDVTEFVSSHPGGKAILEGCGKDATELFETRPMGSGTEHSQRARTLSQKYIIGDLEE